MTGTDHLDLIRERARRFVEQRDWQKFQSPKNLSMAMIVEAGELVELFQWLSEAQSRAPDDARRARIADELADVLIYVVRIADELGIDLGAHALDKLTRNARKHPPGDGEAPQT